MEKGRSRERLQQSLELSHDVDAFAADAKKSPDYWAAGVAKGNFRHEQPFQFDTGLIETTA
ncbi:MAG TPA: hypothetical protein VFY08_02940, partial [Actinomycetota bacterium]|nr:hypothetical protein [Actinomycetota bacterium]